MEMFGRSFENHEGQLPPGFRFHPTDEELITYYLLKKVLDTNFTGRAIAEIDLNKCEPWELPDKAKMGEKEWYFFSLRDRKYPTGLRTNRATESGYWKATGKDREIYSTKTGALVGMKKTLVFYRGRAPKGEKSNWVMHEYRLEGKFAYHYLSASSKDEWVIARVFQKTGGCKKTRLDLATISFSDSASGHSAAAGCRSSATSAASLPPLLDPSSFNLNNHSNSSYSNNNGATATATERQLVPCFSNNASAGEFYPFQIEPPPLPVGLQNPGNYFPSLRALQENLQLPVFLNSGGFPLSAHGGWPVEMERKPEMNAASRPRHVGSTELDCVWTF
ncbi:hypothetical protein LUZ60_012663 [Juncus effusus]|nr:hypothetical protein LUZ60_012663 [Juncus effusus]